MARPRPAPTLLDGGWEGVTQRASRPVMSEMGRCCRKRALRKTAAQYRFKIKRRYAILIQRKECPDSIISKFNSTVLSWILFRQHRSITSFANVTSTSASPPTSDMTADINLRRDGPLAEIALLVSPLRSRLVLACVHSVGR